MSEESHDRRPSKRSIAPEFRRWRSEPTPPGRPSPHRGRALNRPPAGIPPRRVRRKRLLLLFTGVMSTVVLVTSGSSWALSDWVFDGLHRTDPFSGIAEGQRPKAGLEGALTVLVIGSDGRSGMDRRQRRELGVGNTAGERSDSIMLVHLSRDRDRVSVIGLPRDSWVRVPGHGEHKLNAAYAFGGPRLAIETVENSTGVHIDHYVEVDFDGFVEMVDTVGGIEVCLPRSISDPDARLDMPSGTHRVSGAEALAFARTRDTGGGDLDRIDRQQQVLAALLDKVISSRMLGDPATFTELLNAGGEAVTVDDGLDPGTLRRLSTQLRAIDTADVTFTQVPVERMDYRTPDGALAVLWDREKAEELFTRVNDDASIAELDDTFAAAPSERTVPPSEVTVEVYNAVGTPDLGARTRASLVEAGFRSERPARNWPETGSASTVIRHHPDRVAAAATVAEVIPGATLREDTTLDAAVQVVLGGDFTSVDAAEEATGTPDRGDINVSTARENICG